MSEKNLKYYIYVLTFLLGVSLALSIFNPLVRMSLLQDGEMSEFYYRIAQSEEARGDLKNAKHDLEYSLRLNPYHKGSKKALQQIGEK